MLNAAQSLEVKGLTDNGQKSSENAPTPPPPPKPAKPEGVSRLSHPTKRPSPTPNVHTEPSKRPKPIVLKPVSQPIAIAPAPPPAPPAVKEEQPEPQEVIPLNEEGQNWETGGEGGGGAGGGEVSAYGQDDYNDDGGYGGGDGGTVATGYEEIGGYEGGEEYYGDGEGVIAVGEGDDRVSTLCLIVNYKLGHRANHQCKNIVTWPRTGKVLHAIFLMSGTVRKPKVTYVVIFFIVFAMQIFTILHCPSFFIITSCLEKERLNGYISKVSQKQQYNYLKALSNRISRS